MEPIHPYFIHWLDILDFAFQPIADIHSGRVYGVEALLRGTDVLGFATIESFFDRLYEENILYTFDLRLREKAIEKFCSIEGSEDLKLFYNLDNRVLQMGDFSRGNTGRILKVHGVDPKNLIVELSEHNEIHDLNHFMKLMLHYSDEGFGIAIDDFGIGQSGYKLLYHATPNILKIDRFFLNGIDADQKKKLLTRNMVQLATILGCRIVAEGIETEKELLVAKEIGCHLVQGYLIQRPTLLCSEIKEEYPHIASDTLQAKRAKSDQNMITRRIEPLKAIVSGDSVESLLDLLKGDENLFLVPVVDTDHYPLGIIHEHSLKSVIYSPYGRSLISNRSSNLSVLETYIESIPIVDVTMPLETIIELFSLSAHAPGVLVIASSRYIGYLSARELIEVIHERNLIRARDENPLTKLPGNFMINEYIAGVLGSREKSILVYFDFDHFKPYNDHYGFRNGDRVILLFAELMHKLLSPEYFKGHIGGDDFFLGITVKSKPTEEILEEIKRLIKVFGEDVEQFYDTADRQRGCIVSEDRDGNIREFRLLSVSAVVIELHALSELKSSEQLQRVFAAEKKGAKKSPDHIRVVTL